MGYLPLSGDWILSRESPAGSVWRTPEERRWSQPFLGAGAGRLRNPRRWPGTIQLLLVSCELRTSETLNSFLEFLSPNHEFNILFFTRLCTGV